MEWVGGWIGVMYLEMDVDGEAGKVPTGVQHLEGRVHGGGGLQRALRHDDGEGGGLVL